MYFDSSCREKERICGPDGFLDSKRYQRSYKISQKPKDSDRANQHISVVDLRQNHHQHSKDYDKRIKVIEVSRDEILCMKILKVAFSNSRFLIYRGNTTLMAELKYAET